MISSLTSKFELNVRRALFVSTHKVAVYHWLKDDLGSSYLFDLNDEGRENFKRYLDETSKNPFFILVDVFEEAYRQDTIPHVYGADRAAIIKRKVSRLFRDTPYYSHQVVGREEEGRRDDQVLLTAITNPEIVKPWVDMLDEAKVPLVGVYSLPLFTESILKQIDKESPRYRLVVSLQSISGLRQTFFYDGKFRLSRLVRMPRYGTVPYAPYIRDEVEKIRRYLNSLRLIADDGSLNIYFILNDELLEGLKAEYPEQGPMKYHFYDLNGLLANSGSVRKLLTPFSDQFFIHQLLKSKPKNVYASSDEKRYFSMRRLRYSMLAVGILLLFGGVIWGGVNFMGGVTYKQQSIAAQKKTQFYTARYQLSREGLPETPVAAADLKVAIDIVDTLEKYKSSPINMVQLVSGSLNRFPVIQIGKLDWTVGTDPASGSGAAPVPGVVGFTDADYKQTGYQSYQIAVLEGRIEPFDGNFRDAIETIKQFAEDIRAQDAVHEVSIVTLPLDVSSQANLQGNTQTQHDIADFTLRVVLGINHET